MLLVAAKTCTEAARTQFSSVSDLNGDRYVTVTALNSVTPIVSNVPLKLTMSSDDFILLPDQTYRHVAYATSSHDYNKYEYTDSDSDDVDDMSAEEYLKEMEMILRKIRRKGSKIKGRYIFEI